MSTRRAVVCFVLFVAYCGFIAWPAAWLCQESGLGGWGMGLGLLVATLAAVAPIVAMAWVFKGRRRRFGARFRANEELMAWGWTFAPLGSCLSISGPVWLQMLGTGLAVVGTGVVLWGVIRSIPVGEPPDDVVAPA